MSGHAVIDVETTGPFAGGNHRNVGVAVVQVSLPGEIEAPLTTPVNLGRNLRPQGIHQIRRADVLAAATFARVADARLGGRVFVVQAADFDRRFVLQEFEALDHDFPLLLEIVLCTMRLACRAHRRAASTQGPDTQPDQECLRALRRPELVSRR